MCSVLYADHGLRCAGALPSFGCPHYVSSVLPCRFLLSLTAALFSAPLVGLHSSVVSIKCLLTFPGPHPSSARRWGHRCFPCYLLLFIVVLLSSCLRWLSLRPFFFVCVAAPLSLPPLPVARVFWPAVFESSTALFLLLPALLPLPATSHVAFRVSLLCSLVCRAAMTSAIYTHTHTRIQSRTPFSLSSFFC